MIAAHPTAFLRSALHDAGIGGAVRTTGTKAQGRRSAVSVFPEHKARTDELLSGFAQKLGLGLERLPDDDAPSANWTVTWPPVRGSAAGK